MSCPVTFSSRAYWCDVSICAVIGEFRLANQSLRFPLLLTDEYMSPPVHLLPSLGLLSSYTMNANVKLTLN